MSRHHFVRDGRTRAFAKACACPALAFHTARWHMNHILDAWGADERRRPVAHTPDLHAAEEELHPGRLRRDNGRMRPGP